MYCTCKGKGDAILFIHGMPTNGALWDGVIEQLTAGHRCFAVDLPDMGKTPFEAYSPDYLDRMAKQIEALRVRYGVKQWHLVGHDAGSAIAIHYAARCSRPVGCLALLSRPSSRISNRSSCSITCAARRRRAARSLSQSGVPASSDALGS